MNSINLSNLNHLNSPDAWRTFMKNASDHFNVPVEKLHEIAFYFLAVDYYTILSTQQGEQP